MAASLPVSVALVALLLWPVVPHGTVLTWAVLTSLAGVADALSSWRWGKVRARGAATRAAEASMLATTVLMAGSWASVTVVARPGPGHRDIAMLVLCFLLGAIANSQIVNAASTRFFLAFMLPSLSFVVFAYAGGDRIDNLVAGGAVLMGTLALGLHLTANRTWVGAHRLAEDNARLADQLRAANAGLEAANRSLEHRATHDHLTGLANRERFLAELGDALATAERHPGTVGVLFVDVDRFKVLNDSLGHAAGDALLCELAERAQRALGPSDLLARHGGDELTAMLRDVASAHDALERAERLRRAARGVYDIEGRRVPASVSVGLAIFGRGDCAEDLLRHADAALYRAKQAGRDRVELFDGHLRAALRRRVDDEVDLREGLARGEVLAWFQPEIELGSGQILGAEALARWAHPHRGLLPAGSFVELAEEASLVEDVTEAAFAHTARLLTRLVEVRPDLTVRVNVSPSQLADRALVGRVEQLLDDTACPASMLSLEVTETAVLAAGRAARSVLGAVRELGVRVALDDFGTGYSSLSLLAELPLDALKIDRSFVGPIASSLTHRAVVETVLTLGRRLGLEVVAEGVETAEQEEVLGSLGCQRAQGFRYSPALASDRFVEAVTRWPDCDQLVPVKVA